MVKIFDFAGVWRWSDPGVTSLARFEPFWSERFRRLICKTVALSERLWKELVALETGTKWLFTIFFASIKVHSWTASFCLTSLTGKTASLALLTLSESVKDVWPLGLDVVRLYLLSKDVKLLLPSSEEDASMNKEKGMNYNPSQSIAYWLKWQSGTRVIVA